MEFDFIALEETMMFEYIFASEEYPEFTCSGFNDAFGFFINGPGIGGTFENQAINIATIPNSDNAFVSIDNINDNSCGATYSEFYVSNSEINPDPLIIEYDGFTSVLPCQIELIPGETYHLKLAIADTGDTVYDSAVFIRSSTSAFVWAETEGGSGGDFPTQGESNIQEGCSTGKFNLYFSSEAAETLQQITLTGTAIQGEDYEDVSELLNVSEDFAGIVEIPIIPISEDIDEGEETVIINISYLDEGGNPTLVSRTITINDGNELEYDFETEYLFCTNSGNLDLDFTVSSGNEPISYLWTGGSAEALQSFTSNDIGTHDLEITDGCNNTILEEITILESETLELAESQTVCTGDFSEEIIITGNEPFQFTFNTSEVYQDGNSFGSDQPGIQIITVEDNCQEVEEIELSIEICDFIEESFENLFTISNDRNSILVQTDLNVQELKYKVIDLKGSTVLIGSGNEINSIDISSLANGTYVLEITNSKAEIMTKKLLK